MKKQRWNNNSDFQRDRNTEQEHEFRGSRVEVRNNDVNYALRKLKKVLERNDWQKDLAKHEFYEKPGVKRKRAKEAAKKRWQKEVASQKLAGKWAAVRSTDTKFMKSKRKRRKRLDENTLLTNMIRRNGNTR